MFRILSTEFRQLILHFIKFNWKKGTDFSHQMSCNSLFAFPAVFQRVESQKFLSTFASRTSMAFCDTGDRCEFKQLVYFLVHILSSLLAISKISEFLHLFSSEYRTRSTISLP